MTPNIQEWFDTDPNIQLETFNSYLSSDNIVLAALKSGLSLPSSIDNYVCIGAVQNLSLMQNRPVPPLYELGSVDPYFIPQRNYIQLSVARLILNASSLLAVLYPTGVGVPQNLSGAGVEGTFILSLAESFLEKQTNLALVFETHLLGYSGTASDTTLGGVFLNNCWVTAHQLQLASQQTVVAENVAINVGKIVTITIPTTTAGP